MIIDFHCHISTADSKMPDPDGPYYRALPAIKPVRQVFGPVAQEAVDAVAEAWRTPAALKTYRNLSPMIYGEMSLRLETANIAGLLADMADNNVQKSVVVGLDPFVPTLSVLKACAAVPGVLYTFGSVDSKQADFLKRFDDLLTMHIYGIKFHSDLQELPLDSAKLSEMMKVLIKSGRRLPVYLHTGNFPIYRPLETPWDKALPKLLGDFPEITFVCGHAGWENPDAALRCAHLHPNLYLETSWQPPATIRRLCDEIGPERLLFGSDYPLYSQRRALRNVRRALNDEEFGLVSCGNAAGLLGLGL